VKVLNQAAVYQDKDVNSRNADMAILRFQNTKLGKIFFDPNSVSNLFLSVSSYSITLSEYKVDVNKISSTKNYIKFGVKLTNLDGTVLGDFVFRYYDSEKLVIRTLDSFEVRFQIDSNENTFKDIKMNYKFPDVEPKSKETSHDDKFGSFDFETYTDSLGRFIVYAAAYAYKKNNVLINKSFYTSKSGSSDVITAMLQDLCRHKFIMI
jgi:hypothetical protein